MNFEQVEYTAREEYVSSHSVENYMQQRFDGRLGRYRFKCEQKGIDTLIRSLNVDEVGSILDCPTGIGRWIPNLGWLAPSKIVGVDVSPTMLEAARQLTVPNADLTTLLAVAEDLPFDDRSFDLVFCHALFKHLPLDSQGVVLRELARVTRRYVICTLSVRRGPSGLLRRLRRAKGAVAVSSAWWRTEVACSGLRVLADRKVSTPMGVEYSYLMVKDG